MNLKYPRVSGAEKSALAAARQPPAAHRFRIERTRLRSEGRDDARRIQCAVPALVSVRYVPSAQSGKKAQYP